jgi:hypothetical protein
MGVFMNSPEAGIGIDGLDDSDKIVEGSFSRHANSLRHGGEPSKEFPSITELGVDQAREAARTDLLERIDNAPAGTVLFIGGKSDQERTGHTGEVYGEELKSISEGRDDLLVITKAEIDAIVANIKASGERESTIATVLNIANANPDKKVVIDYPLYIKQLGYAYNDRWTVKNEETGKVDKSPYFAEILKKHNNDHADSIHDWLQNDGVLTTADGRTIQGPKPEDIAKQYLQGLTRLYTATKKSFPDRPVLVHAVGHQWDLDAVATYLAKGRVTYEDWQEVMGRQEADKEDQVIGESEIVTDITIDPKNGTSSVKYRGKEFTYKIDQTEEESVLEADGTN